MQRDHERILAYYDGHRSWRTARLLQLKGSRCVSELLRYTWRFIVHGNTFAVGSGSRCEA
jgi:hypothetical protein